MNRIVQLLTAVLICGAALFLCHCGGGGSSGTLEFVETTSFNLGAGETKAIPGDLEINATEGVTIDGEIAPEGDNSQNVTINAAGDIVINGRVSAGSGTIGRDGGGLTLSSSGGDIVFGPGARVGSGNGGDGEDVVMTTEINARTGKTYFVLDVAQDGGARGGNVILEAPNGTIVFDPDCEIHIGNGGDGFPIQLPPPEQLEADSAVEFNNGGGSSGTLSILAPYQEGLDIQDHTTEEYYTVEDDELVFHPGETYSAIMNPGIFTGGSGGAPGDVTMSDVPVDYTVSVKVINSQTQGGIKQGAKAVETSPGFWEGDQGAGGTVSPGDGESLYLRSANGSIPGESGAFISVRGGIGGYCHPVSSALLQISTLFIWNCTPGGGGNATAFGGHGMKGLDPSGTGGFGGNAYANGGAGGLRGGTRGAMGHARAVGGNGGAGGGTCPANVVSKGGSGGKGGSASVFAAEGYVSKGQIIRTGSKKGIEIAEGGNGGNGGDGRYSGGSGAEGGGAVSVTNRTSAEADVALKRGDSGNPGGVCPPTDPEPDPNDDPNDDPNTVVTPDPNDPNTVVTPDPNDPNTVVTPDPIDPNTVVTPDPNWDPNAVIIPDPNDNPVIDPNSPVIFPPLIELPGIYDFTKTVMDNNCNAVTNSGSGTATVTIDPASGIIIDGISLPLMSLYNPDTGGVNGTASDDYIDEFFTGTFGYGEGGVIRLNDGLLKIILDGCEIPAHVELIKQQ